MSGTRRLIVGNIAQSKVRGSALADALARELNGDQGSVSRTKKKMYGKSKKK